MKIFNPIRNYVFDGINTSKIPKMKEPKGSCE